MHAGKHAEQKSFYKALYGVTKEPELMLQHLVQRKEAFAEHAFRVALREALGLGQESADNRDGPLV